MKGVDSHSSCKTHYKDPVIASAYKPDNRTTGGHVYYMAVCNCISYPVRDYQYHSYIRVWIRAGNRHRDDYRMLVVGFVLYVLPIIASWLVVWLEAIKIRLMGD